MGKPEKLSVVMPTELQIGMFRENLSPTKIQNQMITQQIIMYKGYMLIIYLVDNLFFHSLRIKRCS